MVGRSLEVASSGIIDEHFTYLFDTSTCLLLVRERRSDSWDSIERAFNSFIGENVVLKKFCCNLAVIQCEDQKKLSKLRIFGRGVVRGCAINIRLWSVEFVSKNKAQEFLEVWVKTRDLPPHFVPWNL